ncbi:unnamed protein product [Auanema sp. JU1783]|nr:unnamed protein product [Auanema sp. JU1783]
MGISDTDVQKQLRHMMAFIEQEANEKAEEIEAKSEEEFNIEKGRLVQHQRQKIMEMYEKKEKQVELTRKIQASNSYNAGRLKCLKAREEHLENVLSEAKSNLSKISGDAQRYPSILKGLIYQALLQLLEKDVTLTCREKDLSLVEQLLPDCLNALEKEWGQKSKVTVNTKHFLPSNAAGGIELSAKGGKIMVSSTLESRLDLIARQIIPQVRTALFGPNPNRQYFD